MTGVNNKSLEIRLGRKSDLAALAEMRYDFATETGDNDNTISKKEFIIKCKKFLGSGLNKSWVYFVACKNKKIVGHVFIKKIKMVPRPHKDYKHFGYMTNVYVAPKNRGIGIGKMLLSEAVKWAKKNRMELLIGWPSDESVMFYKKLGFKNNPQIFEMKFKSH